MSELMTLQAELDEKCNPSRQEFRAKAERELDMTLDPAKDRPDDMFRFGPGSWTVR